MIYTISITLLSSLIATVASAAAQFPPGYMSKNNPHFSPTPFIRGVNIGAWLVLEKWITPSVFEGTDAVDQWTFDATPGARDKLTTHWSTFFDQTELRRIADTGINALRIPIGYWAYDNTGTPYLSGADAYLERAVHWARESHLKVWIDLHGAPGSQNGNNHSGRAGSMDWQEDDNLQKTIDALIKIATKYGTSAYGDVIIGIELINEPSSWGKNNFTKTKSWTIQAYRAVRAATQNTKLQLIMHDSFQPAANWSDVLSQLFGQRGKFAMDTHPYQLYTDADNALNQDEHVSKACAWSTSLFKPYHDARIPVYAGEWSANSNVCVNPDGSTLNGTSSSQICKVAGCQCVADTDPDNWSVHTKTQVRRYVDAQLQTFEKWSNGYFFWNWKGPGGWNFLNGVAQGWIPSPISSFAKVC